MKVPNLIDGQYLQHLKRLQRIQSVVDNSPPITRNHKQNAIRMEMVLGNALNCKKVYNNNTRMLVKIDTTQRRLIERDKYRPHNGNEKDYSNVRQNCATLDEVERSNLWIGQRILKVTSDLDNKRPVASSRVPVWKKYSRNFVVPYEILSKYKNSMRLPTNTDELYRLLRPTIFFDLSVRNGRDLGRIVIQLYTEACPQVVLQFVRACQSPNTDRLEMRRLFPNLWLEGELQVHDRKLITSAIEYDMRAIDHGQCPGVLSFSRRHLKGFSQGIIDFAISFKPLAVLNNRRVGFGRVVNGLRLLNSLRMNGNKNGGPIENYCVHGWGVL